MDTKQIQTNLFTDGLNTDLHPLTTPNSMLTDCINGTIITYNGNEYILQNDMGNYQLKKAQLSADYIPVGIKEYGNIIYIVSYNPLDKKCQIGSYPSPQVMFDNKTKYGEDENYKGIQINEVSDNWIWENDDLTVIRDGNKTINKGDIEKTVFFTDYSENQNLKVLFPYEGDTKDTFLNPGDKYHLCLIDPSFSDDSKADAELIYEFQKIDFYTLTESKEVYKINKEIKVHRIAEDHTLDRDYDFHNVDWETPGWIGYKPSILNLDSFNIYVNNIYIPAFKNNDTFDKNNTRSTNTTQQSISETSTADSPTVPPSEAIETTNITFNLQGQITITPDFSWSTDYKNIKILLESKLSKFDISEEDTSEEKSIKETNDGTSTVDNWEIVDRLSLNDETDYGNKIRVLTYNSNSINIAVNDNDNIIIRATPYILKGNKGIVYNNFVVYYQINLKDLGNVTDIKTFEIYKYLVSNEDVTINFNVEFPILSNLDKISCEYQIQKIKDGFTGIEPLTKLIPLTECNLLGQNIISIRFTDYPGFNKEEIYVFSLRFFENKEVVTGENGEENISIVKTELYSADQLLITSEVMNEFYNSENKFQNIRLNEWLPKISKYQVVDKNINNYNPDLKEEKLLEKKYNKIWNLDDLYDISKTIEGYDNRDEAVLNFDAIQKYGDGKYVGGINRKKGELSIDLSIPTIFDNERGSLWGDCRYDISASAKVEFIKNGSSDIQDWLEDTKNIGNENISSDNGPFTYTKSLLHTKGLYYWFLKQPDNCRIGDRRYLMKNLTFYYGKNNKWGFKPKYSKKISTLGMWLFQDRYTYDQYNAQNEQTKETSLLFGQKNSTNQGVTKVLSKENIVRNGTFNIQLNTINDLGWFNNISYTGVSSYDDADWDVDHHIYGLHHLPTFIPVAFIVYGNNHRSAGWKFPDRGKFFLDERGVGEGIAVLCESGSHKTVAIIKFSNDENLRGAFRYGSKQREDTFYLTRKDHYDNESPYNYNDIFVKYILGLGLHLFYYTSFSNIEVGYLVNTNQPYPINIDNDFKITYTRKDTLTNVKYKNIELQNGYSINDWDLKNCSNFNLDGSQVVFNTITTKLDTYKTKFEKDINDTYSRITDQDINTYISEVSEKVDKTIADIHKNDTYETLTIYSDYDEIQNADPILVQQLNDIAGLFTTYKGIYDDFRPVGLKTLPQPNIRGVYSHSGHPTTKEYFRSIDLSKYFGITYDNHVDILDNLSKVTDEWYNCYRNVLKSSGLSIEGEDYELDKKINGEN